MQAAIAPPPPLAEEQVRRKRFTRDEVYRMLDDGYFDGQRFELIDGDIIDKMGQKPPHASAVMFLSDWVARHFPGRFRCQLPIEITGPDGRWNEPEPGIAVVKGAIADYKNRHPRSDETALVIEVADSTLRHDAERKRRLYARAGVHEYWIADARGKRMIVHRNPAGDDYTDARVYEEGEIVSPLADPAVQLIVGGW